MPLERYVLVPSQWQPDTGLLIIRREHPWTDKTELAAGSLAACEAARVLLQDRSAEEHRTNLTEPYKADPRL